MRTYISFIFWFGLATFIIRLLLLTFATYPRTREITMQAEVAGILLQITMLLWAGLLLFNAS